ncbi:DUF4065 domain-containing protein [Helicobacter magdeburgensis]|uniref:DUF4065 domain-containing protein n=1 Tax=Helicobacter magdeburgensis TaxID=471858 RepID=A0A4U8SVS7_9HELI|nr:type II toxin-antitoxin system antitoxin SocA domain-containing protein [Helicobacter magdeburgensis]TLD91020.1 DUF4065 domain-containing protein [Helicobacter magdeburgensis]
MQLDNATEQRLNEAVSYLRHKSNERLWARLYQKILFLLELEYFKEHGTLFIGLKFKSYKYGPFSEEVANALDNPQAVEHSQRVQEKLDEILERYDLKDYSRSNMQQAYTQIIDHIHSLLFYHLTPFGHIIEFEKYPIESLFERLETKIDGEFLENERGEFYRLRHQAKGLTCQFLT